MGTNDSVRGARARVVIYSLVEIAKLNGLRPKCLPLHGASFTELPKFADDNGHVDTKKIDPLLPWSDQQPAYCHKPNR